MLDAAAARDNDRTAQSTDWFSSICRQRERARTHAGDPARRGGRARRGRGRRRGHRDVLRRRRGARQGRLWWGQRHGGACDRRPARRGAPCARLRYSAHARSIPC